MCLRTLFLSTLIAGQGLALSLDTYVTDDREFPKVRKVNEVRYGPRFKKECSAHALRQLVQAKPFDEVESFFRTCEQDLPERSRASLAAQLALTNYGFEKKDRFQKVSFKLSTGETLRGIFAIKEAPQPLPLVVIRTGIYGQADFALTNATTLLTYSEHAPFHVLLLENSSNEDYANRNGKLQLGGLTGGLQIIESVEHIEKSELADKFLEFHLVGFSLGAHDALYANIYSSYHSSVRFRSVTALCPALDLEPSIRSVFDQPLLGLANSSYLYHFLERQWHKVPALQNLIEFPLPRNIDRDKLRGAVVGAAAVQLSLDKMRLPAPLNTEVDTVEDFVKLSAFPHLAHHIKTPTYIVQARDDSVTPYDVNLGKYTELLQNIRNDQVSTLSLEQGEHCAYSAVYGLDLFSNLLTGIIERHSTQRNSRQLVKAPPSLQLTLGQSSDLSSWPTDSNYQLAEYVMTDLYDSDDHLMAEMSFFFFDPNRVSNSLPSGKVKCSTYHYWDAPSDCKLEFRSQLPAELVGIAARPGTQEAYAAISRFNVVASLLDSSREEILGGTNPPHLIDLPELVFQEGSY